MKKGTAILWAFLFWFSTSNASLAGNGLVCCPVHEETEETRPSLPRTTARQITKEVENRRDIKMSYKAPGLSEEEAKKFPQVSLEIYAPRHIAQRNLSLTNSRDEDIPLTPLSLDSSIQDIKNIGFLISRNSRHSRAPIMLSYGKVGETQNSIKVCNLKKLHFILTPIRDKNHDVVDLTCKMKVTFTGK